MISLMVEIYKSYFYLFNYYCTQLYVSRLMPTYNAWFEPDVIDIMAYFMFLLSAKKGPPLHQHSCVDVDAITLKD